MKYLHVTTPTRIDLREIFTLGLTSKRGDDSKIGHKGSGMKFTLALLHRLGSSLTVRMADADLASVAVPTRIRDTEHHLIQLTGWTAEQGQDAVFDTHITTDAGADTWTEPWFALRELLQNALDEGGTFQVAEEPAGLPETGTLMIVPLTSPLDEAWANRW